MYNPYQDNLIKQKAMIEQQLQQLNQMPPININNQFQQLPQSNFDFNGKWVSDENEAKQTVSNNLPLILFDKENPIFYMKANDGSLKKYSFSEIKEENRESDIERKVNQLDDKLNQLLKALGEEKSNESIIIHDEQK